MKMIIVIDRERLIIRSTYYVSAKLQFAPCRAHLANQGPRRERGRAEPEASGRPEVGGLHHGADTLTAAHIEHVPSVDMNA